MPTQYATTTDLARASVRVGRACRVPLGRADGGARRRERVRGRVPAGEALRAPAHRVGTTCAVRCARSRRRGFGHHARLEPRGPREQGDPRPGRPRTRVAPRYCPGAVEIEVTDSTPGRRRARHVPEHACAARVETLVIFSAPSSHLVTLSARLETIGRVTSSRGKARRACAQYVRDRFATATAPSGAAWAALRYRRGALLCFTGRLLRSVSARAIPGGIVVEASAPYAGYQQLGARRIPADRSFPALRSPLKLSLVFERVLPVSR